jgi:hypothetical protein
MARSQDFLPRLCTLPPYQLDASSRWEAVPGGHHDSPIFRLPSLPARICVVAERRLASRRHRANFRSAGSPWRREMTLPLSSRFQFTADLDICRILSGMWQVSGAHGHIDPGPQVSARARRQGLPPPAALHDRQARTALHRPRSRLLAEIAKISHFQALLATHSPQIIGDRWDLTIELKGPGEG